MKNKLLTLLAYLVDRRIGVIKTVKEYLPDPGDPLLFCFHAQTSNTRAFTLQQNFAEGSGMSTCKETALAKAIGEAIERYCSAIYQKEVFPYFSGSKAPFECTPAHFWNVHSDEQFLHPQFPFKRFDENAPLRWVLAREMTTNTSCFIPAQAVYIPYYTRDDHLPETFIGQVISTGLACHESFNKAAISGICEVIERDAFTMTWQRGLAPTRINISTLPSANQRLLDLLISPTSQVDIFNITMDSGIPTIFSTYRSSKENAPALVVAAATDLNPEEAVRKCLEELAHTRRFCQFLLNTSPSLQKDNSFENIRTQADHLKFWCDHENSLLASFLFKSVKTVNFQDIKNLDRGHSASNLQILVDHVHKTGHPIYLLDITSEDIRSLGLFVVRAVIPGYHPLRVGHQFRALGGTRLWNVPEKLGLTEDFQPKQEIGLPHPFP